MKKLTDYISDIHTPNMYKAFGVEEERVREIISMLFNVAGIACDIESENQLIVLELMQQEGFVLQNDNEAAFIFYSIPHIFSKIESDRLFARIEKDNLPTTDDLVN